ncbi:MAG: cysteine hydrolase family protein [Promethearchaeota archaeon]
MTAQVEDLEQQKKKRELYIIITCSLQNDFLEPLDKTIIEDTKDSLKLNYEDCQDGWITYFADKNMDLSSFTVEPFLKWIKTSSRSERKDVQVSYHKIIEKYKHRVHVDFKETTRFWKDGNFEKIITDLMNKGAEANSKEDNLETYHLIHCRDWHDPTDLTQKRELDHFGPHCMKGTYGAKFITPLEELIKNNKDFNLIVNSNSLSSFTDTNLESVLDTLIKNAGSSKQDVKIGIFGVISNVKVMLLAFELSVIQKYKNLFICGDICAGFNQSGHEEGIYYMKNILDTEILDPNTFREKFKFK